MSMNIISKLETFHNKLADYDFVWFPFTFLRPKTNQLITRPLLLKLTFAFGSYFFIFYLLKALLLGNTIIFSECLKVLFYSYLIFLIHFKIVLSYFWNRRANRLNPSL
jgi:chromosome condensin MukBEF MukE localization factor